MTKVPGGPTDAVIDRTSRGSGYSNWTQRRPSESAADNSSTAVEVSPSDSAAASRAPAFDLTRAGGGDSPFSVSL
ncbi:MAG: hypothetical protein U5K56_13525 [Halioglobus sp.]|nr:hypothetical protein [Halioglobus sp.]